MANPTLPYANFADRLIDESPDALIALSVAGRVLSWNRGAETIFGYAAEEAVGRTLDELVVPQDRVVEAHAALKKAVETGSVLFETLRRRKDGALIYVAVSESFVKEPCHEPFIAVSKKDVTRLRLLTEQQTIEAKFCGLPPSLLKNAFLTNMSHELRSPLIAIIGFADLMHKGKIGPVSNEQHEYLGDILTSARQLLRLINDILDRAKVESSVREASPSRSSEFPSQEGTARDGR